MKEFSSEGGPAVANSGAEPLQLLQTGHQHQAGGTAGYHYLTPSNKNAAVAGDRDIQKGMLIVFCYFDTFPMREPIHLEKKCHNYDTFNV